MYKIEFDKEALLLTLHQSGFWNVEMVHRYVADVSQTVARLHERYPRFNILSDNREFAVQSTEVVKAFSELNERLGNKHRGRVAVLSSSALAKLQTQRAVSGPDLRRFSDEKEARTWLAQDPTPGNN